MPLKKDESRPVIRYLVAGSLVRSTIVTASGKILVDKPGGGGLYAAGGVGLWDQNIGIMGRINSEYPQEWLDLTTQRGFDVNGIKTSTENYDQRFFAAYDQTGKLDRSAPVTVFSKLGEPLPRILLGYTPPEANLDSRNRPGWITLRPNDIPPEYADATAAHFCPIDFLTHSLLPGVLRQGQIQTITIDPSPGYMNKAFWDDISQVVAGITAFLPSEEEVFALFEGRTRDLRVIAETLAAYGCEYVVIKRGANGVLLYEQVSHSFWEIPAYPVQVIDPTGAGDVFCGGFLAGLRLKYDPLEAALFGSVSASFKIQGSGPFFTLDALPELVEARLEILRDKVKKL
jgi:sugar/nucleoside kinase (ribokinase family)